MVQIFQPNSNPLTLDTNYVRRQLMNLSLPYEMAKDLENLLKAFESLQKWAKDVQAVVKDVPR